MANIKKQFQIQFLQQGRILNKIRIQDLSKIKSTDEAKSVVLETIPIKVDSNTKVNNINVNTEFRTLFADKIYSSIINKIVNSESSVKFNTGQTDKIYADKVVDKIVNIDSNTHIVSGQTDPILANKFIDEIIDKSTGKISSNVAINILPANKIENILEKSITKMVVDDLDFIEIDTTSLLKTPDYSKISLDDIIAINAIGGIGCIKSSNIFDPALISPDLIFILTPSKVSANGTAQIRVVESYAYLIDFEQHMIEEMQDYSLWELNYKVLG